MSVAGGGGSNGDRHSHWLERKAVGKSNDLSMHLSRLSGSSEGARSRGGFSCLVNPLPRGPSLVGSRPHQADRSEGHIWTGTPELPLGSPSYGSCVYNCHQGQQQAANRQRHTETSTAQKGWEATKSSEGLGSHQESGPPTQREYVWSFWHVGGLSGSADSLSLICLLAPSSYMIVKLS